MSEHPVELWRELVSVAPYPPGVEAVPERIGGTAFFPGGRGLWMPDLMLAPPEMPIGKVMIVGQDFHSVRNYKKSLALGCSTRNPTWRNLVRLLKAAGIRPGDCFFTNAYMGLRSGDRSTGQFPGLRDAAFIDRCRLFFLLQLKVLRPRLIVGLGKRVAQFLGSVTPYLASWTSCNTMTQIDAVGALQRNIMFPDADGLVATLAVVTHPSILGANLTRRRYKGLVGRKAEVKLLSDALREL
jgi:hypothetical protein